MTNQEDQSKQHAHEIRKFVVENSASEAAAFYKLIVATASLFIGGTLVFRERIAPTPSTLPIVLLAVGTFSLSAAIVLVAMVRRSNVELARLALGGDYQRYDPIERRSRLWSSLSVVALALGMFIVALAGVSALWQESRMNEQNTKNTQSVETKSMPYREILTGNTNTAKPGENGRPENKASGDKK